MSQLDRLGERCGEVVEEIRIGLETDNCALVAAERLLPELYALAGLAHACSLLEDIERIHSSAHGFSVRVLSRAHYETAVTAFWFHFGGEDAFVRWAGDCHRELRKQDTRLAEYNRGVRARRKKLRKRLRKVQRTNEQLGRANEKDGGDRPLLEEPPVPEEVELDLDLTERLKEFEHFPEADLPLSTIADSLGPLAEKAGEGIADWGANYDVVYRMLSAGGGHPTAFVLSAYISKEVGFFMRPIGPGSRSSDSEVMRRSALVLTAYLGSRVLGARRLATPACDAVIEDSAEFLGLDADDEGSGSS